REGTLPVRIRRASGAILASGTLVYAAGYTGLIVTPAAAWLIPLGAAVSLAGFGLLGWAAFRLPVTAEVRAVLSVFLFGMAIDIASGLFALDAAHFLPAAVGPEDGVRQRMLRLARVAATALPLLVLLFRQRCPGGRWGRLAVLVGAAGMPGVLTAA